MHSLFMAPMSEDELAAIRDRHHREGEALEAERIGLERAPFDDGLAPILAHQDRERLLTALEHVLPLHDAARRVVALIQRGPLPPVARQALLELQVALATASLARVVEASFEESLEEAEDAPRGDMRLSA